VALAIGGLGAVVSAGLAPAATACAASQDWPPFILVSGLLLVGMVARDEGLFDRAGAALARVGRSGPALLIATAVIVAVVTVTLNLDTSVTFLTPVVLAAARGLRRHPEPFLYLVVAMSNGASLLLPGSNLTNLIVLHDAHHSGASLVSRVGTAWLAAVVTVVAVVALVHRHRIVETVPSADQPTAPTTARSVPAVIGCAACLVAMLVFSAAIAALVVAALGVALAILPWSTRQDRALARARLGQLNAPLLAGLLGAACGLGALGRVWSGPARMLAHASTWQTAGIGAVATAAVNNLPAASLLAARPVAHASALLVGLNLGPNLTLWGSLAGVLWSQAARGAGWQPSARRLSLFGLVMVPATMAAALGALSVH
jgi:arsenical pump membrane protein